MKRLFVLTLWVCALSFSVMGYGQSRQVPQLAPPKGSQGPHGAATEQYQQTVLDKFNLAVDEVPAGVSPAYWNFLVPDDNEPTAARVALGKKLYFDPRLSKDGTVSCATCHDTTRGFSDQRPTSEGIDNQLGTRNSPTVMNVAFLHKMFWDGRSPSIEHQARQPIINPIEMGMPEEEAVIIAGIKDDPEYIRLFQESYGNPVNYHDIGQAMAAFERTLIFLDSPVRRFLNGDSAAMTEKAKRGWVIFNTTGRCASCHPMSPSNPIGSDNKFHNIGIAATVKNFDDLVKRALVALETATSEADLDLLALSTEMSELGLFLFTKSSADIGAFRTPSLTNIGVTAPYMHDGSLNTLWDVVDHYNKGGVKNDYLDGGIEPLNLTEDQVFELVEFLFALTDVRLTEAHTRERFKQMALATGVGRSHRDLSVAQRKVLQFESPAAKIPAALNTKKFDNEESFHVPFVYPQK